MTSERIDKRAAAAILGCSLATVRAMAVRGDLAAAGAARIGGGKWTFNEARLRSYVRDREEHAWREAEDERRPVATGEAGYYGAKPNLRAAHTGGRLTQTMQQLRKRVARQA